MGRTALPGPIWKECNDELDMYELYKLTLADFKAEIMGGYEGRNQQLGRGEWDKKSERMGNTITEEASIGGGGSIHHTKLDTAIEKLTAPKIIELEKKIQRIEEVYKNLTPLQQHFFDLHYRKHYNMSDCAKHMNYCRKQLHTFKREVIEKTAVRLGYIR